MSIHIGIPSQIANNCSHEETKRFVYNFQHFLESMPDLLKAVFIKGNSQHRTFSYRNHSPMEHNVSLTAHKLGATSMDGLSVKIIPFFFNCEIDCENCDKESSCDSRPPAAFLFEVHTTQPLSDTIEFTISDIAISGKYYTRDLLELATEIAFCSFEPSASF